MVALIGLIIIAIPVTAFWIYTETPSGKKWIKNLYSMTQLDGVTFTIVAKSGRSIPYMALCQVGQEMAGKSIFTKYLPYV